MTPIPEWIAATIRYIITIAGVLLVSNGMIEQTVWDEAAVSLVSLLTALYGVLRTRQIEQERDAALSPYLAARIIGGSK